MFFKYLCHFVFIKFQIFGIFNSILLWNLFCFIFNPPFRKNKERKTSLKKFDKLENFYLCSHFEKSPSLLFYLEDVFSLFVFNPISKTACWEKWEIIQNTLILYFFSTFYIFETHLQRYIRFLFCKPFKDLTPNKCSKRWTHIPW